MRPVSPLTNRSLWEIQHHFYLMAFFYFFGKGMGLKIVIIRGGTWKGGKLTKDQFNLNDSAEADD
jgi:hypothetical protein